MVNPNAPCAYCANVDTLLVEPILEGIHAYYVACPRCQANGPRLPTADAARAAWNDVAALWRACERHTLWLKANGSSLVLSRTVGRRVYLNVASFSSDYHQLVTTRELLADSVAAALVALAGEGGTP